MIRSTFAVKEELQKLFVDEEEAVIQLALESTDFDLQKAQLILSSSQERDESFSTIKNLTLRHDSIPLACIGT